MSKKKNTLKDLDEFLKQQAASLVSPEKLSEKIEEPVVAVHKPVAAEVAQPVTTEVSAQTILKDLKVLASKEGNAFRSKLYDLIISSLESDNNQSPEDMMLINTALYLKSGDNWKNAIKEYWGNKI
ncbi:MAG TPA: hypothetical protein VL443_03565 [Cyclobacteriaceae bacterium]|jgi:hypothetical protein|nr:hypothetical protein [Cyclobacteriaceae bacterium]